MKKITALFLSLVLVFGLAACGSTNSTNNSSTPATSAANSAKAKPENNGKILVVYYSATGNTKRVAQSIAEAAGANLFEI